MIGPQDEALLTDLYQLTMLQGYFTSAMGETAVFELFVRTLPQSRNFLVAAGVEQCLDYLERLHFTPEHIEWLHECGHFRRDFVDALASFRFTGDVHAIPDGTIFFPGEPVLRVQAPIAEAQLVESRLINLIQFQTLIASKATRCVLAAPDKLLVDFGMRRAHGAEAALMAARAAYLAGFDGTATVLAGKTFGIPVYGTMAHSFVQTHDDEIEAFEQFARANPGNVVLLLDTYETDSAATKVVELAKRLRSDGIRIKGVRIDSGDLAAHAVNVRQILDEGGLRDVTIFASGYLDENRLRELVNVDAPIDGFGIGSRLDVSDDAPCLDCVYKLQEYAGQPRRKRSEGKATWPGSKQIFRLLTDGRMTGDVITLENEAIADGMPLLQHVMRDGRRIAEPATLSSCRDSARKSLGQLPAELRTLDPAPGYPVEIAASIRRLARDVDRNLARF